MELLELQSLWNEYDSKLAKSTKINKRILKEMLIKKPLKTVSWMRIKSIFQIISGIIIIVLFFKDVELREPGFGLYMGIILFSSLLLFSFFRAFKYFLMLRSVSLVDNVLTIKEKIINIQKFKLLTTKYNFIITPPSILAVILLTPIQFFQHQIIIPTMLFTLVYIILSIYRLNWIKEEFSQLNRQLKELEDLED